jgi:hypothetical protein
MKRDNYKNVDSSGCTRSCGTVKRIFAKATLSILFATLLVAPSAYSDVQIEPPSTAASSTLMPGAALSPGSNTYARKSHNWLFQFIYGVTSADVDTPAWDSKIDPPRAVQRSTTGFFSDYRFSHAYELQVSPKQTLRMGLSLLNTQTLNSNGWLSTLAKKSKAPDWRSWGLGSEVFLVRHSTSFLDIDAGLNADYLIAGIANLPTLETASQELQDLSRLEQKSGWRFGFSGGIGGLYLGPVGLILRISGQVSQIQFKGHNQPLRIQGIQIQLGAGLDLGRGDL